jgi:hypothetical protein
MPASSRNTPTDDSASERSALKCKTCGQFFAPPDGHVREASTELVEEESLRCSRVREILRQRQVLAARMQAGISGVVGSETVDTTDLVSQRQSLTQLDAALKAQAEALSVDMLHVPREP